MTVYKKYIYLKKHNNNTQNNFLFSPSTEISSVQLISLRNRQGEPNQWKQLLFDWTENLLWGSRGGTKERERKDYTRKGFHMHSHTLMAQTECVSEKKRGGRGVRVRTAEVSKCVCVRERVSQRWLPLHPHPSVSKVRGRWSSYCAINWHHLVQFSVEERLVKTPDQVWLSARMTLLLIFICFPVSPNQHW